MFRSAGYRYAAFACEVNYFSCCKEYSALNLQLFYLCLCDATCWSTLEQNKRRCGYLLFLCMGTSCLTGSSKGTPGPLAQQRATCRSFRQHKLVIGYFQYWEWGVGPGAEQAGLMLSSKGFASTWSATKAKVPDKTHKHQAKNFCMQCGQALTLTFVQTVSISSLSLQAKNIHQEELASDWRLSPCCLS